MGDGRTTHNRNDSIGDNKMPDVTTRPPLGGLSPGEKIGLGIPIVGAGATAGAFPTTTRGSSSQTQSTQQSGWNLNQIDLQNILNTLNWFQQGMTGSTATQMNQAVTPTYSPQVQGFINNLLTKFGSQATPISPAQLLAGNTQAINAAAQGQSANVENTMAARGLSTSPVAAAAQAAIQAQRVGNISSAAVQAPITANQLNLANLLAGTQMLTAVPKGYSTTGTTGTEQNQSQWGQNAGTQTQNQTGSQTSNFANYGNTQQTGNFQQSQGGGTGSAIAGGLSALLSLLALFSDKKLKKDIKPIDSALDKIVKLKPVTWKWKGSNYESAGVLAQDLKDKLPNLVHVDKPTNLLRVEYAGLIPYLIKSVQELAAEVRS